MTLEFRRMPKHGRSTQRYSYEVTDAGGKFKWFAEREFFRLHRQVSKRRILFRGVVHFRSWRAGGMAQTLRRREAGRGIAVAGGYASGACHSFKEERRWETKLPFGNFPRLILAWICTEAIRPPSEVTCDPCGDRRRCVNDNILYHALAD